MTRPGDGEPAPRAGSAPGPAGQEAPEVAAEPATPSAEDGSALTGSSDATNPSESSTPASREDREATQAPTPGAAHEPGQATGPGAAHEPGQATGPGTAHEPGQATGPGAASEPGWATGQGTASDAAGAGAGGAHEAAEAGAPPQAGTRLERRREERRRSRTSFFAELPVLLLVAFVLALLLKTFLIQAFYIPSESMVPTLAVGDRVLVNKLAHDFRGPERGEVIVFSQDDGLPGAEPGGNPIMRTFQSLASGLGFVQAGEKDFIKRIVGLPGETIEMREGVVYIDGEAIPEQPADEGGYLSRPDFVDFGPVEIPEGEYFLMGDNRPNSSDSRSVLSTIAEEDIIGRAFAVVWPLNRFSVLSFPDYQGAVEASEAEWPEAEVRVGGSVR